MIVKLAVGVVLFVLKRHVHVVILFSYVQKHLVYVIDTAYLSRHKGIDIGLYRLVELANPAANARVVDFRSLRLQVISDFSKRNALEVEVYGKEVQQEPIVKGLGIRANKVQIFNEGDCIKVKPRTWLDKKDWREIHDILRVQGFNWLANGKDSCWIKLV